MDFSFHPLRVRSVRPETAEAVVVDFDVPPGLQAAYAFIPGQYLTLRATVNGQDLRRSYSICAGLDDGALRVGVRKVPGGVFSNWVNTELRAGDTLQVMVPQGRFFAPPQPEAAQHEAQHEAQHHLGIAGGSGITPILSIMKTVLAREPHSRFTLLYGNRQLRSTMFRQELADLKDRYLTRLAVHHVFSDEHTDSEIQRGLMNREKVAAFLQTLVHAPSVSQAYLCGPFQMNDEAEAALLAAGLAPERIHVERFGIVGAPRTGAAPASTTVATPSAPAARITLIRDGLQRELRFEPGHTSVLDCASRAGLAVPNSCTSGVCGTCRAKVVEGEVQMDRNFALDKAEVAAGFVLTCQTRPLGERLVLSFDER